MSEPILVTLTCDWCRKEGKARLVFLKPRGWIKHRTLDKIDMLFCSLACFRAFKGTELATKPVTTRPSEVKEEEQLVVAASQ